MSQHSMEDLAQLTETDQEEREKRALVKRITQTAPFRNAPRIREFLLFICDLTLTGRAGEISESRIGTDVFHRQPGYDTSNDNIVRVTARQLRAKLLEYFESEGRSEALRLEIPKGSYVPSFQRPQPAQPVEHSSPPNRWRTATGILALFVVGLMGLSLGLWRRSAVPAVVPPENRSILDLVVRPDHRTFIVLSDSSIVYLQQFSGHPLSLEQYANRDYSQVLETRGPEAEAVLKALAKAQLTSVAGLGLVSRVFRLRGAVAGNIEVRNARS